MNFELRFAIPRLIALEKELASPAASPLYARTADLWRGGGAFITDDAGELNESHAARRGDLGVFTRHARPLSWLFFALQAIAAATPTLDEAVFFGRLADAANGFLAAHQPESDDWRPLLAAVIREARRAVAELPAAQPVWTWQFRGAGRSAAVHEPAAA